MLVFFNYGFHCSDSNSLRAVLCNILYRDELRPVTKCGQEAQSSFTPVSNVWLSLSQFSRDSRLFNNFL